MKYIEIDSARIDALKDFYNMVLPYMEELYPNVNKRQILTQLKLKGIRGFLKYYRKIKLDRDDKKALQDIMIEEENKPKQPTNTFLKYLQWRFDFFNKKFFRNRLSQIPFEIIDHPIHNKLVAAFSNREGDKNIRYASYIFCKSVFVSKSYTDIVLLHEMCHHAVFELDKKLASGKSAHNSNWKHYMELCGLTPPEDFQETITDLYKIPNWKSMTGKELFRAIKERKAWIKNHNNRILTLMKLNKETAIKELMSMFEPAIKVLYKSYKAKGKISSLQELKDIFIEKMNISIKDVFKYFNSNVREKFESERQVRRILIAESRNWNVTGLYPKIDKKLGF